jgi:hypothetical protein
MPSPRVLAYNNQKVNAVNIVNELGLQKIGQRKLDILLRIASI